MEQQQWDGGLDDITATIAPGADAFIVVETDDDTVGDGDVVERNNGNNHNDNGGGDDGSSSDVKDDDYRAPVDYDKMVKLFKLRKGTRLPMKDFLPEVLDNRQYSYLIHT